MGSLRSASKAELAQYSKPRLAAKHLIESQAFELALSGVIVGNLFMMVLEIDTRQDGEQPHVWMRVINGLLLFMFVIESCVRAYVYRLRFVHDRMCILDAVVVGVDVVTKFVEAFSGSGVSILRLLRLLRLSRATLIVEQVPELSMLVRSLIGALQPIFWGSIVLVFMLAAWGVLAVQFIHPLNMKLAQKGVYDDCERCTRAYKSVWQSSLTMVQQIIAGDAWGAVTLPIIEEYPPTAIFFVTMFVCLQVALMNVVLACVVDSAARARLDDLSGSNVKRQLAELCDSLDEDCSGEVSYQELLDGFQHNKEFKHRMSKMDIRESDLDIVWDIMDADGGGTVTTTEFVDQLVTIKRANPQTMLIMIRHYILEIKDRMNQQMKTVVADIEEAEKKQEAIMQSMHKEAMEAEAEALQCENMIMQQQSNPANGSPNQGVAGAPAVKMPVSEQPQAAEPKLISEFGGNESFMDEHRKFMADIQSFMKRHQQMEQKIDVCLQSKLLQVPSGALLSDSTDYEAPGAMQFPPARPGLPVVLCPAPSCCASQKIVRPSTTRAPEFFAEAGETPGENPVQFSR